MPDSNDLNKKSIHTLESDLASAVNDKNYGRNIIKIITNPDNKKNTYSDTNSGGFFEKINIKKAFILIFFSLVIISTIVFFILYRYMYSNTKENDTNNANTEMSSTTGVSSTLIKNSTVLNPEIIQNSDFSKFNKSEMILEIDNIKNIILNNKITPYNNISIQTGVDISNFFEKIRYSGELGLIRSFSGDYSFGLYSMPDNEFETYILIKINDFDLALSSMLGWEQYIVPDIKDIFKSNNTVNLSTTTVVYKNTDTFKFIDKIIKNYDVRLFVDNKNNITILYGSINNKYLLITSGESSYIDIKDRLLKENIRR